MRLGLATHVATSLRVKHPGVHNTHSEDRHIHSRRPMMGAKIVLKQQIALSAAILEIYLGTRLIVDLRNLRLTDGQGHTF